MMDILYRSKAPAYRGSCAPPQQASTGMLSGFWCALFGGGGGTPAYRTVGHGRGGAAAPAESRCWWQAFQVAPAYKTAPEVPDDPDLDEPSPDGEPEPDGGCAEGVAVHEIFLE